MISGPHTHFASPDFAIFDRTKKTVQYFMSLGSLYMLRKFQADIFKNGFLLSVQSRASRNMKNYPRFRKDPRIRILFGRVLGPYTIHMSTTFEVNRIKFDRVTGEKLSKKSVPMLKDRRFSGISGFSCDLDL